MQGLTVSYICDTTGNAVQCNYPQRDTSIHVLHNTTWISSKVLSFSAACSALFLLWIVNKHVSPQSHSQRSGLRSRQNQEGAKGPRAFCSKSFCDSSVAGTPFHSVRSTNGAWQLNFVRESYFKSKTLRIRISHIQNSLTSCSLDSCVLPCLINHKNVVRCISCNMRVLVFSITCKSGVDCLNPCCAASNFLQQVMSGE